MSIPSYFSAFPLQVQHWLNELSEELSERLDSDMDQNKRIAHTLTLHARAYKVTIILWLIYAQFSSLINLSIFHYLWARLSFVLFISGFILHLFYSCIFLQRGDLDSHKKFPSKSCPLRYGTTKIQEDALTLFHAGLRDFLGIFNSKTHSSENNNWGITALSVSASKIVPIPSVSLNFLDY